MGDRVTALLERLSHWVHLHPIAGSRGLGELGEELARALSGCGFDVVRWAHASGDLLIARRSGAGPLLGMYGHYDVEPGGRTAMLVREGRVFGRGVADNLGPLALRLSVVERYQGHPNLLWVLEPGEESGSHALADWCAAGREVRAELWLDETGYFDVGGTQRLLAVGATLREERVLARCAELAAACGRSTRLEARRLRRVASGAACAVDRLFDDAPYLAFGPNDDASDVHGELESLPLDTLELSMRQFEVLLDMAAGEVGR